MLKDLYDWMIHWAATPHAVPALFFIALAESSFFPLPPDLLLIALCLARPEQAFFYAVVCTVGSVLGGIIGLGIGRYGGRPLVDRVFDRQKILAAEKMYQKYGAWAIGIAGFTPVPYKVFTILSGVLRIRLSVLAAVSVVSRGARFFLVSGLIYFYGVAIQEFINRYFNLLSVVFMFLLVGGFFVIRLYSVRAKKL